MSTKVCVEPVKPGWKDAVTLGQLRVMLEAFHILGVDESTPVTYLYDHRHVWLETVHDVDDDFDIEVVPEPRVVEELREELKGSEWLSRLGHRYRWSDASLSGPWQRMNAFGETWSNGWLGDDGPGPYTEVLP